MGPQFSNDDRENETRVAVVENAPTTVPDGALVTIDSAPVIYYLEDHPLYAERFSAIFDAITEGRVQAVISSVTLAEVLSGPLGSGKEVLAAQYREVLCRSAGWQNQG